MTSNYKNSMCPRSQNQATYFLKEITLWNRKQYRNPESHPFFLDLRTKILREFLLRFIRISSSFSSLYIFFISLIFFRYYFRSLMNQVIRSGLFQFRHTNWTMLSLIGVSECPCNDHPTPSDSQFHSHLLYHSLPTYLPSLLTPYLPSISGYIRELYRNSSIKKFGFRYTTG